MPERSPAIFNTKPCKSELAASVRKRREALGLTQSDLAQHAGVLRAYSNSIERDRYCAVGVKERILAALERLEVTQTVKPTFATCAFGSKMHTLRVNAGLSREELAIRLKVPPEMVRMLETGRVPVDGPVAKLALYALTPVEAPAETPSFEV